MLNATNLPLLAVEHGVKMNFDLPFIPWVQEKVGAVWGLMVILCFLGFIIACGVLIYSKLSSNSRVSDRGSTAMAWVLFASILIGSASAFIGWATSENVVAGQSTDRQVVSSDFQGV